jgi:hypothetical protein
MDNIEDVSDSDRYDFGGDEFVDSITGIDTWTMTEPREKSIHEHLSNDAQEIAHRLASTIDATTSGEWFVESDDVESYLIKDFKTGEVIASGFKNFYDAWLLVYTRERGKILSNVMLGSNR